MTKEDYKYIPLAAIGLVIGIGEVLLRPFIEDQSHKVGKQVMASITYFRSGAEDDADRAA